nr:Multidrug transporter MdtC [Klebsiella pneumoniae]
MAVQDIRVGGRQSNASYQYTLLSDDLSALREWEPKIRKALAALPELADVNSDQQDNGAEMDWSMTGIPCRASASASGRQQPAEQRLWPAADLYHLPAAQPV